MLSRARKLTDATRVLLLRRAEVRSGREPRDGRGGSSEGYPIHSSKFRLLLLSLKHRSHLPSQLEPGHLELIHPSGITTIVRESEVTVTDRGFLSADVVRRSGGKGQAGLITKLDTRVELVRVLSNEPVEGTFDTKEVIAASRVARGDHVVYNDWIGMVEETFEMALVETKSGPPRRVCDSGSTLTVGATSEVCFDGFSCPAVD